MAKRNRKGGGGVYEDKTNGKFVAAVSLGKDAVTGRRIRRKMYFDTWTEANNALDELKAENTKGEAPNRQTLSGFLDEWLETEVKPKLAANSYFIYRDACRFDIKPHIGSVKVQDITKATIKTMLAKMTKAGRSMSIQQRAWKVLSTALTTAELPRNPFRGLKRPASETAKPEVGSGVWNEDQTHRFIEHPLTKKHRLYGLFAVMVFTGARINELLALHREDLDLKEGRMSIRRGMARSLEGPVRRGATKTRVSVRTISLSPRTVDILCQHLAKQAETLLAKGLTAGPIVFASVRGTYLLDSNTRRLWKKLCKDVGVPVVTQHAARHGNASAMLAEGVDVITAAARLGHSPGMLMDTYAHMMPSKDKLAAEKLDSVFGGN